MYGVLGTFFTGVKSPSYVVVRVKHRIHLPVARMGRKEERKGAY